MTLELVLCKGAPSSGKSTWAKAKIAENPDQWLRCNNDDIRSMCNDSIYSPSYEKLISSAREFFIREGLKSNRSIILDNVNSNDSHWEKACSIAKSLNKDITVSEMPFYLDLPSLIARDAARTGTACVGEKVVRKFWKELGGESFKDYAPRKEVFTKDNVRDNEIWIPRKQDSSLDNCLISDLDGTISIFAGKRSPYDASRCNEDDVNPIVQETINLYYKNGHKIIFCSGREDKYREPTVQFLTKHFPGMSYKLLMRKSGDLRKDSIIKEEIFLNDIEGKYNVRLILDDRDQVVFLWRSLGLTCFQVAPGNF